MRTVVARALVPAAPALLPARWFYTRTNSAGMSAGAAGGSARATDTPSHNQHAIAVGVEAVSGFDRVAIGG